MLTVGRTAAQALAVLSELRAQRERCTLFVFGDGADARRIAEQAHLRADGHEFRQVVWVPEPLVIDGVSGYQALVTARDSGARVVVTTIEFRLSRTFGALDTLDLLAIEEAFIDAELDT
jgi:hypothetical protein